MNGSFLFSDCSKISHFLHSLARMAGGLVIEGVTIGAGAGGYCFRVRGRFRGFCDQGGGVEGCAKARGDAFNSHGSFRSCRKKAVAASSAQSRRQKSQQIQTLMISLGQGEPERLD